MMEIVRKRQYINTNRNESDMMSIAEDGEDLDGHLVLAQVVFIDTPYWVDSVGNSSSDVGDSSKRQRIT